MANITITNLDQGSVILQNAEFRDELLKFTGAGTVVEGTILARKSVADAITAAADGGNTGNGTVTSATVVAGKEIPQVGAYNLECVSTAVASGTATATAAADGGNTGNGTVTSLSITADTVGLIPGAYNLEMIELGVKNGTATGTATADGGNTGNGTAGAVTAGSEAKAGNYIVTCTDATVSGSEIFEVIDPDGERLEDLTVGVAYSNNHFGVTISDGATDFVVGDFWTIAIANTGGLWKLEDPNGSMLSNSIIMDAGSAQATAIEVAGISFTITDGATDFVVGDKFAITVANTVGLWKLEDPNGFLIADDLKMAAGAGTATTIKTAGMSFIITDGATDFIVGDKFSLTVAADGDLVPYVIAGLGGSQVPIAILTYDVTATGAADIPIRAGVSGSYRKERLVIDADGDDSNITDAIMDQLRVYGLVPINVKELNVLDNQ
jgi:hypothetical protein